MPRAPRKPKAGWVDSGVRIPAHVLKSARQNLITGPPVERCTRRVRGDRCQRESGHRGRCRTTGPSGNEPPVAPGMEAWAEVASALAVALNAEGPDARADRLRVATVAPEIGVRVGKVLDELVAWSGTKGVGKADHERNHALQAVLQCCALERLRLWDQPIQRLAEQDVSEPDPLVLQAQQAQLLTALEAHTGLIQRLAATGTLTAGTWRREARALVDAYDLRVENGYPNRGKRELLDALAVLAGVS